MLDKREKVDALVAAGLTNVNHVVSGHNYRHLVRFVEWLHGEFGTKIGISFAYVSPQYKALERLGDLVPRYRDVMPYLKRAIASA